MPPTVTFEEFEWDDDKRRINRDKHAIDFPLAAVIFRQPHVDIPARSESETRRMAIGPLDGRLVSVVYTPREGAIRIISARRARENEERAYRALLGS